MTQPSSAPVARFRRTSGIYDRHSQAQRMIGDQLLTMVVGRRQPCSLADLGCGTGYVGYHLATTLGIARVVSVDQSSGMLALAGQRFYGVAADVELLQADLEVFALSSPVELCVCSCVVQWLRDFPAFLVRVHEALRPGGLFALSVLAPGTLRELGEAYRTVTGHSLPVSVHYRSRETIADSLPPDRWRVLDCSVEERALAYDSPRHLLRQLSGVGATAPASRSTPTFGRRQLEALESVYLERFRTAGSDPVPQVTATWAWSSWLVERR